MARDTLRSINQELIDFMDMAEAADIRDDETDDGTVSFNFTGEMEKLMEKLEGKLDGVVDYVFKLQGDVAGIDEKMKALEVSRTARLKKVERLVNMVKYVMRSQGMLEVDTGEHTIKLKKNPPKVDVTSEGEIPEEYFRCKVVSTQNMDYEKWKNDKFVYEADTANAIAEIHKKFDKALDKKKIKEDLKAGEDIPGVMLIQEEKVVIK